MTTALQTTIREMIAADLDAVVELDRLSFSAPWSRTSYQFELNENPNAYLWVAETAPPSNKPASPPESVTSHPQIVGILAAWLILDELHIASIAVLSQHRRQGIAARLLETGLRNGIKMGATMSHLEVRKSNLTAQTLYHRFGFKIVGERKKYYPDTQEDAILMSVYHLGEAYLHWLDRGRPGSFLPNA